MVMAYGYIYMYECVYIMCNSSTNVNHLNPHKFIRT